MITRYHFREHGLPYTGSKGQYVLYADHLSALHHKDKLIERMHADMEVVLLELHVLKSTVDYGAMSPKEQLEFNRGTEHEA